MQRLEQDHPSHVQQITEQLLSSEREKHTLRQQLLRAEETIRRTQQEIREKVSLY